MPTATDALLLSAEIYDAAIEPNLWEGLLNRLAREVGAKGAVLLALETLGQYRYSISLSCSLYSEATRRRYEQEFARHEAKHFSNVAKAKPGEIVLDEDGRQPFSCSSPAQVSHQHFRHRFFMNRLSLRAHFRTQPRIP
jgi:hypothetical protein